MASANIANVKVVIRAARATYRCGPRSPVQLGLGQSDARGRVTPELRGSGAIGEARTSQVEFPVPASRAGRLRSGAGRIRAVGWTSGPLSPAARRRALRQHAPDAAVSVACRCRGRLYLGRYILGARLRGSPKLRHERRTAVREGESRPPPVRQAHKLRRGRASTHRRGCGGRFSRGAVFRGSMASTCSSGSTVPEMARSAAARGTLPARRRGWIADVLPVQRESYDAAYPGIASSGARHVREFQGADRPVGRFTGQRRREHARAFRASRPGGDVCAAICEAGLNINRFIGLTYRLARDTGIASGAKSERSARALITLSVAFMCALAGASTAATPCATTHRASRSRSPESAVRRR